MPLPPDNLPLRRDGHWRKRWRYVGAFSDELLVCAARINVGPLGQTFWAIWDREERKLWERTKLLMPGARGDVLTEGRDGDGLILHSEAFLAIDFKCGEMPDQKIHIVKAVFGTGVVSIS